MLVQGIIIAENLTDQEASKIRQLVFNAFAGLELERTYTHNAGDTNYRYQLALPAKHMPTKKVREVTAFAAGVLACTKSY